MHTPMFSDLNEIKQYALPVDWWTKYFLHPISIRLVSLVRDTLITPNLLTILSTLFIFLAFPLICFGDYTLIIAAGIILQLSLLLDCADGQLARIRGNSSVFGEWFDRGSDRFKDFLIIFALSYRYMNIDKNSWVLGFFCLFIIFFIDFLGLQSKASPLLSVREDEIDKKENVFCRQIKNLKRKIGFGFFQIGEQYLTYSIFLILNRLDWMFRFIIAYGTLSIVWFIFNTYREKRLFS